MKLPIALGIAAAALTVAAASAQSSSRHVVVHGDTHSINRIDANEDGWVTRAEASTAYERIFADLDSNDDGKLDRADRRDIDFDVDVDVDVDGPHVRIIQGEGGDRHVRVITGDLDEETEARIEREVEQVVRRAEIQSERAEREAERAEREAERAMERAERDAERAERLAERHAERHVQRFRDGNREVIIIRSGDDDGASWTSLEGGIDVPDVPPVPPVPAIAPVPPVPPVPAIPFMMLIANSEEADRDGDGALSRDEFVAQHLRFFDASDANGDGRVRFDPPRPPVPPIAPTPPEPPRRR